MRLDKYLADMGCGTRSELRRRIHKGEASVDGRSVKDPGYSLKGGEAVLFAGKDVSYEEKVYYMLHKPAGVISASEDKKAETVLDLIREPKRRDLFPVGRLDKDTEGLLLITNDGDMAHRLLAPGKHVDKVYEAEIDGNVTEDDVRKFEEGLVVDKALTALPAKLEILKAEGNRSYVRITIQEGKFHQIKRMFRAVGKEVTYLKRISMGMLTLDESLAPGEYRRLTEKELKLLEKGKRGMTADRKYNMIAFDMDGTLLNSRNRISEKTENAIREAAGAGRAVVIATGRSLTEVLPYRKQFEGIRYAILESGAMLYDLDEDRVLKRVVFPRETVEKLEAVSRKEDILLQVMADGKSYIEQAFVDRLEAMGVAGLREFVEQCETVVPDLRKVMLSGEMEFEKINLYHVSKEERLRSLERVREIDAESAFSANASLEMSPSGVTKGNALRELAEMTGIPIEETIAVGDSGNDIAMLKAAGLAVAMGNADEELREAADVTVATNEEDGCEEAIRRFLLA